MNPLFPVSSKNTLFPLSTDGDDTTHSNINLDWLQNKSFPNLQLDVPELQGPQANESVSNQDIQESSEEMPEEANAKEPKKRKKKKHKHKNKKKKSHKGEVSRSPSPLAKVKTKVPEAQGNKVFTEELPYLEPEDAFRIDRKSNIHNWKYESLYKGHIATFSQSFRASLGGDSQSRDTENKKKHKTKRYYSRENRKLSEQAPLCHLVPSKDTESVPSDVIPVPPEEVSERTHGNLNEDIRERLMDTSTSHYIKGEGVEPVDNNVSLTEMEERLNKRTAEFNRRTREEPHNTDLWLEFVEYQDSLLRLPESEGYFKMSKSVVLEKKIAILKKAMEVNQGNIVLKLKYLQLCQEMLEPNEVNKEMEDLLFHNPTNITLWKQYLMFNQSRLSQFSVSRVCKLYQKCITTLVKYQEGKLKTHTLPVNLSEEILGIFVQLCTFLKQAGHKEKAIASFQALVELNLCCPERLKSADLSEKAIILESFWDIGVPRFGEEGAKGWNYWMDNKNLLPTESENNEKDPSLADEEEAILQSKKEKWETWLQLESLRESAHWLPWKPDLTAGETMDDCEDVDRLVLFEDISPFLFCLPEKLNFKLLIQFLIFLGFENCQLGEDVQDDERLSVIFNILGMKDFQNPRPLSEQRFLYRFIGNIIQQGLSKFNGVPHRELTVIWLRYQTRNENCEKVDCKKFKKMARNVLKDPLNRNSKAVWMEYSLSLSSLGGKNEAVEVLEMAIPMLCVNTDDGKEYIPAFYRTLVELFLNFPINTDLFQFTKNTVSISPESMNRSVHALICLCENQHNDLKNPNSTFAVKKLKSRRKMEELIEMLLQDYKKNPQRSKEEWLYLLEFTKCCTLFEYVISDLNLDSAMCVLNKVLSLVFSLSNSQVDNDTNVNKNFEHSLEQIFRYKVKVIHHHISVRHSSLSPLRATVEAALEIFPDHVYFLNVFTELERGCMVFGRLDRFCGHHLGRVKSPDLTVFAVASLIHRKIHRMDLVNDDSVTSISHAGSGVMNKIRCYLEKSLDHPDLQHCSVLWSLYLYCEARYGQSDRASGLFYRSLQQCPWVKGLYLDGVRIFQNSKLEEITDLMLEKEIRLQIPLEEIDILQS
ncbi:nuclear exosome regulator NRDE2-like [Saccostrea echinata]|uniref:nuclear exosome regulator NRDE2-like n=1 Tax=Saccostrea echinata TaxID=191078 RepID=UPI002A80D905|nr:nuclear exosome regulator NRDE2-like [Saccostrea echinata]